MSMRSVALAAMAACASLAHAATTYSVQQLPCIRDAAGCSVLQAIALSPAGGFVLGVSSKPTDGRTVGTVWSGRRARHLVTPDADYVDVHAINDRGLAVGTLESSGTDSSRTAVHWTADGHVRELPALSPGESTEAFGIGSDGDIAGLEFRKSDNAWIPVMWHRHQPRALAVPAGLVGAFPHAMSPTGVMAGSGYDGAYVSSAVLWSNGTAVIVGPRNADASGVNDSGQVVGSYDPFPGVNLPFIATTSGWSTLPALAGGAGSAFAIDSHGVAVGTSGCGCIDSTGRAVRWVDGQVEDLNALLDKAAIKQGWVLYSANAIDEAGRIIAIGQHGGGDWTTVLLVPSGS